MGNCLKPRRAASWADGDEWGAEAEVCKGAAAEEKAERVELKIRVTRRQLQELLEKAAGAGGGKATGRRQVEELLAELMTTGRVCYQQQHAELRAAHWRPSLYSIPEAADEES